MNNVAFIIMISHRIDTVADILVVLEAARACEPRNNALRGNFAAVVSDFAEGSSRK
jgi:hypothetical protein